MKEKQKSMVYVESYIYMARKLIIKKDCTLADLDEALIYLEMCKDLAGTNDARIDVWRGKLELKRSRMLDNSEDKNVCLESAKNSFFMSLAKDHNLSAHFGLYKIAILQDDWVSARAHLRLFEKGHRKNHCNFRVAHKMLDACLGEHSTYEPRREDYIFSDRVTYAPIVENYRLAEKAFDSGKYNSCLKHLLVCRKLAVLKGITVDFSPLIYMVSKLIDVKNYKTIDELKIRISETTNYGEKVILIRKLISITPNEIELYFLLMDSYISLGVYCCIPETLEVVRTLQPNEEYVQRIAYYEALSNEQNIYSANVKDIISALNKGDSLASDEDLKPAYDMYLVGFKSSGNSVFLWKIGNLFYKHGFYEQAEKYYLEYLSVGYERKLEVYMNLYKVYRRLNNDDRCREIMIEAYHNMFLKQKGYTIESWAFKLESEYNKELEDSVQTGLDIKIKDLELISNLPAEC